MRRGAVHEQNFKRALAIREKILGPDDPTVAETLVTIVKLYLEQGRYVEAESLARRALAIREKALQARKSVEDITNVEAWGLASALTCLGQVFSRQGHFAEAEATLKRSLALEQKAGGSTTGAAIQLAHIYIAQGRYAEAEPFISQALSSCEKRSGPHDCVYQDSLAILFGEQQRYTEAESLWLRKLSARERELGTDDWHLIGILSELAVLYEKQERYEEAETVCKRALALAELVSDDEIATSLYTLAKINFVRGQLEKAGSLIDRAIPILDKSMFASRARYNAYLLRARIAWKDGRRGEALGDLRQAMEIAEQLRAQAAGAEHERAEFFARFSGSFEQMVAWQTELGDAGEVLTAMERGRARSLLDELAQSGADMELSRPVVEREKLRNREIELRQRVATIEQQLQGNATANDLQPELTVQDRAVLEAKLTAARAALYEHYRDARSSNPVYRNLLATGGTSIRLSQLEREVVGSDGLLLAYLVGEEGSYVLSVGAGQPRITALTLDAQVGKLLGMKAGPLTAHGLQQTLAGENGLLQELATARKGSQVTEKLAGLWKLLIPEADRESIGRGAIKQLIVVPDGPLALLPFETLVIVPGAQPQYLLDAGPPILYAPSATVLYNLKTHAVATPAEREPVLSVANPNYGKLRNDGTEPTTSLAQLTATSRYRGASGSLLSLPNTQNESAWITQSFQEAGQKVLRLVRDEATESNVRQNLAGREVVHIACHGLADQSYGNYFGALAFTPGPRGADDPADDGFLTLPEIYELKLNGCELAILSACQTNYGPQQQGEGVWTLSRGFLVAGCRRVVASNWLVDDEAAATLMHYFCGFLADARKQGQSLDHATALQRAKRTVRQQEKWQDPYYWGTFVLVGPN